MNFMKKKFYRLSLLVLLLLICRMSYQITRQSPTQRAFNGHRILVMLGIRPCVPIPDFQMQRRGPGDSILYAFATGKKQPRKKLLLENDELVCMIDDNPDSEHHLLILPRESIWNVSSLRAKDIPLLARIKQFAMRCLEIDGGSKKTMRLIFHRPPFISQDHLHLHVKSGKEMNSKFFSKYIGCPHVSLDEVLEILKST